ncbi:glycosyltransferase family 4 protein [Clostridium peptidivorans]|uniref:glycosyltransferase family 4 protein n=1 Tax=Clostridium peptidivorans TaxID=100174 RepID=UPI0015CA42DE|nr:glycosyltransferase family 4 protein [Clostridium peptidivorans]
MKKRVLLIAHEFPPKIGGAGMVAKDICNNLAKNDIQVDIITEYIKGREKSAYNLIEIKTVRKLIPVFYYWKLCKINLDQYDKIILNDAAGIMCICMFFNKEIQKKCIVYMHGQEVEGIFINPSLLYKITHYKKGFITLLDNCFRVVSVGSHLKNKFISKTNLRHLEDKIEVIKNGIDTNIFHYDYIDLHKKFNIPKDTHILLSVSRIVEKKGYDNMYKIFKRLILENERFHWMIAGDGEYLSNFKQMIENDGLSQYITFLGRIKRESLRTYYSSVDMFWLLSNYEEALPLSYLEAQFCNTVAMGRNDSGTMEVIKNDKTGFLVNNDEEAYTIIKNREYEKLRQADKINYINEFSMEKNSEKLLNLIL